MTSQPQSFLDILLILLKNDYFLTEDLSQLMEVSTCPCYEGVRSSCSSVWHLYTAFWHLLKLCFPGPCRPAPTSSSACPKAGVSAVFSVSVAVFTSLACNNLSLSQSHLLFFKLLIPLSRTFISLTPCSSRPPCFVTPRHVCYPIPVQGSWPLNRITTFSCSF